MQIAPHGSVAPGQGPANPGARILVVDDEPGVRRGVRTILVNAGYAVETAEAGEEALAAYSRWRPDVVLLDLGLPDMDGLDVIRAIRAQASTPIVVLSMRGAERDKVAALDLGADDYVDKPFGIEELLARIRVALRHAARPERGAAAIFRAGELVVDLGLRQVSVAGREVRLTPTEFELLRAFIAHPNKVLTHHLLIRQLWGPEYGPESAHQLHVHISSLRKKIEPDPRRPQYILTEPGLGYRLRFS